MDSSVCPLYRSRVWSWARGELAPHWCRLGRGVSYHKRGNYDHYHRFDFLLSSFTCCLAHFLRRFRPECAPVAWSCSKVASIELFQLFRWVLEWFDVSLASRLRRFVLVVLGMLVYLWRPLWVIVLLRLKLTTQQLISKSFTVQTYFPSRCKSLSICLNS